MSDPPPRSRSRCVMEVFTFIFMGGDLSRITLLPIGDDRTAPVAPTHEGAEVAAKDPVVGFEASVPRHHPGSKWGRVVGAVRFGGAFTDRSDPAVRAVLDKFATFDAAEASCYLPDDKQMILGVIETGIGSIDAFNQLVRSTFAKRGTAGGIKKSKSGRRMSRVPTAKIVLGMEKAGSEF